ncbi:MYLK3 kinase, partial [Centropus unirufus]|nr:MYLK3 kinase [Centropus unirufus]
MDEKLSLLNEKMDKLLHFQEDLTGKLQRVNKGSDDVGKGFTKLTVPRAAPGETDVVRKGLKVSDSAHQTDVQSICSEVLKLMKAAQVDASKHRERLAKIERRVDTLDKVITFVGEVLKNSKVVDFILKGIVPWKKGSLLEILDEAKDKPEESGAKPKQALSNRGTQTESPKPLEGAYRADSKPQVKERRAQQQAAEGTGKTQDSESCQQQKDVGVKALNQHSSLPFTSRDHVGNQTVPAKAWDPDRAPEPEQGPSQPGQQRLAENENKAPRPSVALREASPSTSQALSGPRCEKCVVPAVSRFSFPHKATAARPVLCIKHVRLLCRASAEARATEVKEKIERTKEGDFNDQRGKGPKGKSQSPAPAEVGGATQLPDKLKHKLSPKNISSEAGREVKGDNKQDELAPLTGKQQALLTKAEPGKQAEEQPGLKGKAITSPNTSAKEPLKDKRPSAHLVSSLDDSPSPPAPFEHRIVSVRQTELSACYSVCRHEVLGGGRFGQVHKCTEISTGLSLAAKIIKVKGAKEREEVKNEINIMNQLNHVNLIQLYDAFEAKNNITLIMEYLDGGELFDRITDENYNLTELDAILFTRQICEGVHYLHQHYILHLDLKPENVLCVNRTGNQIKIIDFGFARRYKPREKLKVNFGTPEFLAPEVVNYDFVSFPTDMWSVGVITYMLLSGLSPFLGETDAETMNYVVNCNWDFDAEAFEQLSEEAKDFISRLLVKEKSCRMSATQCLKHEWLNNLPAKAKKSKLRLKSQLLLQSYMTHRKWKKHFYVVAAANRLKRFQSLAVKLV